MPYVLTSCLQVNTHKFNIGTMAVLYSASPDVRTGLPNKLSRNTRLCLLFHWCGPKSLESWDIGLVAWFSLCSFSTTYLGPSLIARVKKHAHSRCGIYFLITIIQLYFSCTCIVLMFYGYQMLSIHGALLSVLWLSLKRKGSRSQVCRNTTLESAYKRGMAPLRNYLSDFRNRQHLF